MPRQYTRIPLEERFWSNVTIPENPNDCWLWTGPKYSNGYGRCWDGSHMRLAHRVSYEFAHGPDSLPSDMDVLHNCAPEPDRKDCVNPAHLWLGTQADNARDAVKKGQLTVLSGPDNPNFGKRQTHCTHGHEMTSDNVLWTNGGRVRRCRTCYMAAQRAGALRYLEGHRAQVNAAKRARRAPYRVGPAVGERHGLTTLTEQDVRDIRATGSHSTFVELARRYHVSPATIANIVHRKTWKHVH